MKKILAMVLALVMVCGLAVAAAAANFDVSTDAEIIEAGETVNVTITLDEAIAEAFQLQIELEYLEKYRNMPFYDEALYALAWQYLYALDNQEQVVEYYFEEYYDYYQFWYAWYLADADRYAALDKLSEYYGFGEGKEQLESLLGTAESLRQWADAWYEIHACLSTQLWGLAPYEENGVYYLEVYNYTGYTFSFTVYEQFCDAEDTLLNEYEDTYVTVESGATCRVVIAHPGEGVSYWYIDWEIYDIYLDGVLLE